MPASTPAPRWSRRAVALAAALGCYLGLLAVDRSRIVVRGASMLPRLWPGDVLLTVPVLGRVRPGQVVVARDPHEPDHLVVKRVTAIRDGLVLLHGDNPDASTNSRAWGPVPTRLVRRVAVRRWPDLRTRLRVTAAVPDAGR
ncbi:MAG: nickel-type superoxide dismutase maturation protease [Nitriliruptoraceae bacterium]